MKSKYVIKYDNFLKKCKNMENFQKNMGNHENIRNLPKNRKIEKSMKIKKIN